MTIRMSMTEMAQMVIDPVITLLSSFRRRSPGLIATSALI